MSDDLREQLQTALGAAYTLERELGGGGMSRVFVARDEALAREVVVKVLPTDVAGVSVDRFKREISTAARLQHPHIVPLLSAGEMDGVPYYMMPFVTGDSLRARLKDGGALPIGEATRLLRDIASALAYAHHAGVVHRDIKPDNVLLSGGSAAVTDFGVAKALRDAASTVADGGLTQIGIALGTPIYMAPEQAAADPNVDHRADLYSVGVMAYEMVTGVPPFRGRPAQELLVAHLTEEPEPVGVLRPDLPPQLASLIMWCLAKRPEERPQSAEDVVAALDAIATGPVRARLTSVFLGPPSAFEPRGGTARRAIGLYVAAAALTAGMAKVAVLVFALPDWIFTGAAVLLVLGLPLFSLTAWLNRGSRKSTSGAVTGARSGVTPTALTWRKASLATAGSLVAYALFVSGFVMLRALGVGPAASLMAAGRLNDRDRILVADFSVRGADTSLGNVVTEAFRADLRQSRVVTLVQEAQVRQALVRMQLTGTERVDASLARQVAMREGVKAIVTGEIQQVGTSYLLLARLEDPSAGNEMVAFRESATDASQIIPAIDRLSRHLREKIGESLREIRANPPLEQVTTPSLPALKAYAAASRLIDRGGDLKESIRLLEEAISLDTTFAMAYRKLGITLSNTGIDRAKGNKMLTRAREYSVRLPELERHLTEGTYYMNVANDEEKALSAYRAALAIDPANYIALNNSALVLMNLRQHREAEALLRRQVAADTTRPNAWVNLVAVVASQGKLGEARTLALQVQQRFPTLIAPQVALASLQLVAGHVDSAQAMVVAMEKKLSQSPENRVTTLNLKSSIDLLRGHLAASRNTTREVMVVAAQLGAKVTVLDTALVFAMEDVFLLGDTVGARRRLDAALAAAPLSGMDQSVRPYLPVASLQALLGRPAAARAILAERDGAIRDSATLRRDRESMESTLGSILMFEKKYDAAIAKYRMADAGRCSVCTLPVLGYAYDLKGERDSSIAIYERYRNSGELERTDQDPIFLAGIHKRLGELYEAKGDARRALDSYERFVALWSTADAPLQPRVREARKRVEALRAKIGA